MVTANAHTEIPENSPVNIYLFNANNRKIRKKC